MDKKRLKEIISLNLLSRREFIQPILEEKIELICLNDVFFYRNSSKIRVSIENINFSKNLVIFFLPIAFLASRPNSANAQTRIQLQQEKTCRYFESQTEKPNFKKIILADLREPKNFISQQNEIFQFHEKNVNENLKLPLSKKQEGVFNPIKFSILAKNSKILCKNEKNSFVKSFYFFISWIFRNKILILSFGVGVLILTLVIYYGFHQNNVLNVQKNEIKIPALSQPKKLNFDCMNYKIDLNNQKRKFQKLVKLFNQKVNYFNQNGKRLYPNKIIYAEKRILITKRYERLVNFGKLLDKQTSILNAKCF